MNIATGEARLYVSLARDRTHDRTMMRGAIVAALLGVALLLFASFSALTQTIPALTGRIVDDAGIIPATTRASLEPKLQSLEEKSGIQLVVASVKSLGGQAIEPYANQMFRAWKLGEKQKNNGVLLLVAPNERKVRIEVGYGLEGTLTDALSKIIIANAIAPRFKANDFGGGIERGVDDIITVLTTDSAEWQKRPEVRPEQPAFDYYIPLIIFALILFHFWISARSARGGMGRRAGPWGRTSGPIVWMPSGGGSSWGGGGGSSGGGGFSGGGGSSGGGGASGDW